MRSEPNKRIKSSSSEMKKCEEPGIALARATAAQLPVNAPRFVAFRADARASRPTSATPAPSLMSVPRPAMFVAMVTAPRWPARATISASCW